MKILLVSNGGTERCGVAQYGRHLYEAARFAGIRMVDWDASGGRGLPEGAEAFDLIHVNWHAATIGHLSPEHFPKGVPVTIYLHEPASLSPLLDIAVGVFATEVLPLELIGRGNTFLYPNPCPPYRPVTEWSFSEHGWKIGNSGIRHDGLDWVSGAIAAQNAELLVRDGVPEPGEVNPNAWMLSQSSHDPDGWLSDEAELERLASCALCIYHYHSGNSGQSYAVMMGVAAGRPLLLNSNRMLQNLLVEPELYVHDDAAAGIELVIRDIRDGRERRPWKLREERSWDKRILVLKDLWERLAKRSR